MGEFGSDTIIDDGVALLILDCFDTLVELDEEGYRVRRGVEGFLRHYGERLALPLVVHSDACVDHLHAVLETVGLRRHFRAIYGAPDAVLELEDGLTLKRLDKPVDAFAVAPAEALFIGDSRMDAASAKRYGLRFIRVPGSADRDFDFASLIAGPSRYQSQEYTTRLFRRYGKEPPSDG